MSTDAPALLDAAGRRPSPHSPELRAHLAEAVATELPRWIAAGRRTEASALLEQAWDGVRAARRASPLDVRLALIAASLASHEALIFSKADHLDDALRDLDAALRFAPARQDLKFALARTLLLTGHEGDALDWAEEAYDDEPDVPESVWQYAAVLRRAGREAEARKLLERAIDRGLVFRGMAARFARDLLSRPR